jgi:hypothetical protein
MKSSLYYEIKITVSIQKSVTKELISPPSGHCGVDFDLLPNGGSAASETFVSSEHETKSIEVSILDLCFNTYIQ